MKLNSKLIFGIIGAAVVGLIGAGCVSTVAGGKTPGIHVKDAVEGNYERPVDQVFDAAKDVIKFNGTIVKESILHDTNVVKTVEGKVNQCNVWVRVEQVDPKVTSVKVQTRTPGGGTDIDLAHQVEKEIALKLVSSR